MSRLAEAFGDALGEEVQDDADAWDQAERTVGDEEQLVLRPARIIVRRRARPHRDEPVVAQARLPGLAFRVILDGPAGPLPVGDGGLTPWTQTLLADREERFLASAMGTELLCKLYAP